MGIKKNNKHNQILILISTIELAYVKEHKEHVPLSIRETMSLSYEYLKAVQYPTEWLACALFYWQDYTT